MAKTHNTTTAPTAQIAPFGLRMLPDLRAQIEAAAKASGRSMNAEIVARLERSFETRDAELAQETVDAMINALARAASHAESLAKRLELIEKKRRASINPARFSEPRGPSA